MPLMIANLKDYKPPKDTQALYELTADEVECLCTTLIFDDFLGTYLLTFKQVRCLTRIIALQWHDKTHYVRTGKLATAMICSVSTAGRAITALKACGLLGEGPTHAGARYYDITPMLEQFQKYIEKLGKEV